MSHQNAFPRKEEVKSPAVILFGVVYLLAIILGLRTNPWQTLIYIGMSFGIVLLIWFIMGLTEKRPVEEIHIRKPGLELAFAFLVYLFSHYVPLPRLKFGQEWFATSIARNLLFFFVIPFIFLKLRKYSLLTIGLSISNGKQNLKIGAIAFACLAIPSAVLISNSASLILNGQLSVFQAVPGFFILFTHNIFLAGLPEEFFYRGFIQTRLCKVLSSNMGGILITALLFSLIHIPSIQRWYPGIALSEAFCRAFFVQGITSLIEGVLWFRTHSLIPGIMVHSGINALNNLGFITSLIFK